MVPLLDVEHNRAFSATPRYQEIRRQYVAQFQLNLAIHPTTDVRRLFIINLIKPSDLVELMRMVAFTINRSLSVR
jgi:hypothetical protein